MQPGSQQKVDEARSEGASGPFTRPFLEWRCKYMRIGYFQRQIIQSVTIEELKNKGIEVSTQFLDQEITNTLAKITQQYDIVFEGFLFHLRQSEEVDCPVDLAGEVSRFVVERLSLACQRVRVLEGQAQELVSPCILERWGWKKIEAEPNKYVLLGEYKRGSLRKAGMIEVTVAPSPSWTFFVEEGGQWVPVCVNADSIESGIQLLSREL